MRIGIDCRKIFDFGIGTYVRGLVHGLREIDAPEEYVLFAPSRAELPERFERVNCDVPNYSVREMFAFSKQRLDLFHAPDINVPFVSCPTVVTIHDLIRLHYPPRNAIARGYVKLMTARALRDSRVVLTVSEASREVILGFRSAGGSPAVRGPLARQAGRRPANRRPAAGATKTVVTPNGIDERFFAPHDTPRGDYFLFVGNNKPHKNVGTLLAAARGLPLILAGGKFDHPGSRGFVDDDELLQLYRGALALVLPSLEEGFGLPAAEAMACGTPVIVSNTPALVELTGDAALHFDPHSVDELAAAMQRLAHDSALREDLSRRGRERAMQFTWRRCAELTRSAYLAALG